MLGLLLAGPCRGGFSQVKPESWHHRCQVSVCSSVLVSSQQRFGVTDIKALGASQLSGLGQTSVTALFYLEDSRRIHPRRVRACQPKDTKRREWRSMPAHGRERERVHAHGGERHTQGEKEKEKGHARGREREKALWLFLPRACPMQIGLSQECCSFYLKSSLRSSDLPLTFLCSIFVGFSLPCLLATDILDSFSLF